MARTKLRDRGQLTLPPEVRAQAHLEPGDPVEIEVVADGAIVLRPMKEIYSSQAWFWTPGWQAGEAAASADIAVGRTRVHKSSKEFLAALDE